MFDFESGCSHEEPEIVLFELLFFKKFSIFIPKIYLNSNCLRQSFSNYLWAIEAFGCFRTYVFEGSKTIEIFVL